MRSVYERLKQHWYIIIGASLIFCGIIVMPGCEDWDSWAKQNPEQAKEIARILADNQDAYLPPPTTNATNAIDRVNNALNNAKPLATTIDPATGGVPTLAILIASNVLTGLRMIISEIESRRMKRAILDLHNNTPNGAVPLAKTDDARDTLKKITGDKLGLPLTVEKASTSL